LEIGFATEVTEVLEQQSRNQRFWQCFDKEV
jgi:hypothetical protein